MEEEFRSSFRLFIEIAILMSDETVDLTGDGTDAHVSPVAVSERNLGQVLYFFFNM